MLTKKDILLDDEGINVAEKKGAKEYKKHIETLELPYSPNGLVLFIQHTIAKASALHALEAAESYYEKEWGVHDFEIKALIKEMRE